MQLGTHLEILWDKIQYLHDIYIHFLNAILIRQCSQAKVLLCLNRYAKFIPFYFLMNPTLNCHTASSPREHYRAESNKTAK